MSMWLESVLFATRFIGLLGAAFHLGLVPMLVGRIGDPGLAGVLLVLGLAALFRIRALLKAGKICPAAIGTATEN
ncbi:hypothetical protein [uncultured Sphingomonas sp.]|uniref:hypothetical protein n=1 Tax=uncultured Sphingomonas sp. TaxID=158754 RepID=UPI0035CAAD50